jgi:hypothetical protein
VDTVGRMQKEECRMKNGRARSRDERKHSASSILLTILRLSTQRRGRNGHLEQLAAVDVPTPRPLSRCGGVKKGMTTEVSRRTSPLAGINPFAVGSNGLLELVSFGGTQAAERTIESFVPLFDVRQLEPMNVSRSFLERNCSGSGAGVSPAGPGLLPALVRPRARRPHDRRDARPTT